MNAIIALIKREPILLLTLAGIVVNTVAQAVAGGADAATVVQDVIAAVLGFIARSQVTPAHP